MKIKSSKGEILTVPDGMEEAAFKAQAEGRLKEFADGLKERVEAKKGGMLKRKDGSYSRRGLWDNIRANRGSGRKPTKEMLKQEKKIRAKAKDGIVVGEESSTVDLTQVPQGYFLNPSAYDYKTKPMIYQAPAPTEAERLANLGRNAAKGTAEQDYTIESFVMPMPAVGKVLGKAAKGAKQGTTTVTKAENLLKAAQKEEKLNSQALSKLQKEYKEGMHRVHAYKNAKNKFEDDLLEARYTGKNIKDYGWNDQDIELLSGKDRSTGAFRNNLYLDDNAATGTLADQASSYYEPMHLKGVTPHDPTGHSIFDFPQAPKEAYTVSGYTAKKPSTLKKILTFGLPDDSDRIYNIASKYDRERSAAAKLYNLERAKEFPNLYNQPYKVTEFPILNKQGGAVTTWSPGEAVPFHTSTIGEKMGKGGYTVKRSSARKGKTHVVIGPDGTKKYFGDSKLGQHPGNPKRKKSFYARHAKNLRKNPYFRAFARATWDDGGKLTDNIYDLGLMPYMDGGAVQGIPHIYSTISHSTAPRYAYGGVTYDGTIDIPEGYDTPAYNERYQYDLGGDIGAGLTGIVGGALGTVPLVGGVLQQGVNSLGEKIQGPLSNQEKAIRGFGTAAGGIGAGLATGNIGGAISQGGSGLSQGISVMSPESATAQGIAQGLNVAGTIGGMAAGMGAFGNAGAGNALKFNEAIKGTKFGNTYGALNKASAFNPLMSFAQNASNIKMADGGQSGLVPINVEGADFSEGSGPDARKGELLVLKGRIYKNYVGRPPHPAEGQDPMGNDDAPEGLIVIPKNRTKEYLEAGLTKRQQIERSLVSQQQNREMKKSRKMGDGGYYSFGMGEMGMAYGGPVGSPMGNPDRISPETFDNMMTYKKGGWIQKVTKSIKRRGTEGVCTGSKFGSSSCPPGSRRYNLAKTFRKMAKARKHEYGGFVDPVTGSHTVMYAQGGELLPESLLESRMRASGKSNADIQDYMSRYYKKEGGPTVHDFPTMGIKYMYGGRAMAENGMVTGAPYADTYGGPDMPLTLGWDNLLKSPQFTNPAPVTASPTASNIDVSSYYSLPQTAYPQVPFRSPEPMSSSSNRMSGPSSGMSIARSNRSPYSIGALRGIPEGTASERYMQGVDQDLRKTFPGLYNSSKYGTSSMSNPSSSSDYNYANMMQDFAGVLPAGFNLAKSFDRPYQMKYLDYEIPAMQFRKTRFDQTPYDQAASRAQYALRQMGSGPGYKAAIGNIAYQTGQARSQGYMDWLNKEALRRQGVDEANLNRDARNVMMKYEIDTANQQAREKPWDYAAKASEQIAQTFGRDPMYFAAMAGQAPRQPFTGYRKRPGTSSTMGTSVSWDKLNK